MQEGRSGGHGEPSDATLVWMRCRAVVLATLLVLTGVVAQTAPAEGAGQSTATRVTIFGDSAATAMAYDPEADAPTNTMAICARRSQSDQVGTVECRRAVESQESSDQTRCAGLQLV